AHGLGVVGGGRGSSFVGGTKADVPLQMGTLSKALGSYGGYVCASAAGVDLLRNRARTALYSTGLPPANVAAPRPALSGHARRLPAGKGQGLCQPRSVAGAGQSHRPCASRRG